jgi:RimJ/RimL family protein N-acetyltransferase
VSRDLGSNAPIDIRLRPFEGRDSQKLLDWRNHESVRLYSRSPNLISQSEHEFWVHHRLSNSESSSQIFIAENSVGGTYGMVRLDLSGEDRAEISIIVDPTKFGRGFGSLMLKKLIEYSFTSMKLKGLIAVIHKDNSASLALFRKFGFVFVSAENDFCKFDLLSRAQNLN